MSNECQISKSQSFVIWALDLMFPYAREGGHPGILYLDSCFRRNDGEGELIWKST